jgi:two-component system sensor histidine kinase UhpB
VATFVDRLRSLPLFWQIFLPSAVVLVAVAAILALSPAAVSSTISSGQTVAIFAALVGIVLVNLLVIRRAVAPLERLTRLMARVDPLEPGQRAPESGSSAETAKLAEVFNAMLDRLEIERRESAARMLSAQENERLRLARELHDEIGQSVTGLMLELDTVARQAPETIAEQLRESQEAARAIGDELREVVRGLRPEALDDLGLQSALVALTERFAEQGPIEFERRLDHTLTGLGDEADLVVYRVAQEGLTNVVRHSGATRAVLELSRAPGMAVLRVIDDGHGFGGAEPGTGIRGMRERAMLIGGRLSFTTEPDGGGVLTLQVPIGASA